MDQSEKIIKAKRIAVIAGIFTALVSLLMILNYMQIRGTQPLESRSLELLVERLSADPGNQELIEEIRQLDLLARKAYFTSLWQIRTGAYLLLFGAIALIIALRTYYNLTFAIHPPEKQSDSERRTRLLAQRWIAISGAGILVLAGLSAFFTADHIRQFDPVQLAQTQKPPDDGIERLTISPIGSEPTAADTSPETKIAEELTAEVEEIKEETAGPKPTAVALTRSAVQQNHNAFRGPWGNGIITHRNIPVDWDGSSGRNIIWKVPVPVHGYNSPIIWGDYLFFSGANTQKRMVYSMNRHTGQMLWEREVNNIPGSPATPPRTTDDTGLAAPSLTTDGNRVFALFGTGDIIAFDFSGNRLWARNLGVPDNHYGHSSSLLTWDNKVFVQYDTHSGSRVMALNAATGENVWSTTRTNDVSWASPILAEVNGEFQLIMVAVPDVSGHDIRTGRQLWSVRAMSGEVGPSPAFGGGLVFAANEYATMVAINPATGEKVWEDRYYLPEVSSPVYHDGLVYIATTFAVLASFDAKTGDFVWEFDADDIFYSSPVIADGRLYIFDTSGKAYIFKPGREPELIATPQLGERVYSTPAFADGRIYIRGNNHIFCIGAN